MSELNENKNEEKTKVCERCSSTEEVTDTLEIPWREWLCKKCRNPEGSEN
jgi:hypothetical protein